MSLKGFHIVFVTLSTLLALAFAGWSFRAWSAGSGGLYLALAAAGAVAAAGLLVYGAWFLRKMKDVSSL